MPIDPGTALIASSAISAGGSLLGGFMSSEGGLSEGQKWIQAHPVQSIVNDARLAGVHPLYALGNVSYSPMQAVPGQNAKADAVERAAQAVAHGVSQAGKKVDPVAAAQVRALDAQAENDFAQAHLHNSNARLADMNYMNAMLPPVVEATPEEVKAEIGSKANPYPSHLWVKDLWTGEVFPIPNTQAGYEMPEAVGGFEYGRGLANWRESQERQNRPKPPKGYRQTSRGLRPIR